MEPSENGLDLSVEIHRVTAPVREQLLGQLREAIVSMQLRPGQHLIERELIERTGVSRTTIREVLRQLAAEGLVTTIPNKGTVVARPSLERAEELYEIRGVLEGVATRQFAERADENQMRALEGAYEEIAASVDRGDTAAKLMLAKKRFYDVLLDGADNQTIQEIIESLQARVAALRSASLAQPGRGPESVAEIREIVEALKARDPERARQASVHHVEQAARTILSVQPAEPREGNPPELGSPIVGAGQDPLDDLS